MFGDVPAGADPWSIAAASVPGKSHTAVGRGSDDAYAWSLADDGSGLVAAVADGAGSRTGTSAWGSYIACQVVSRHATTLVASLGTQVEAEAAIEELFAAVLAGIGAKSRSLGLTLGDLSTTLAVAVLGPSASVVAQVGDGIVVCEVAGKPAVRIPEEKGEYANETVFVTSSEALRTQLRHEYLEGGVERFALSTDGLRYKLLNIHEGGSAFVPFYTSMWRRLETSLVPKETLANFLDNLDDQTGDDKTLIIGARSPVLPDSIELPSREGSAEPSTAVSPTETELISVTEPALQPTDGDTPALEAEPAPEHVSRRQGRGLWWGLL